MQRNHASQSVPVIIPDHLKSNHLHAHSSAAALRSNAVRTIVKIHNRISEQVNQMNSLLTDSACRDCLRCIYLCCADRLKEITEFIHQGHIFPWIRLRLGEKHPTVPLKSVLCV
jgi:hypothetical protein